MFNEKVMENSWNLSKDYMYGFQSLLCLFLPQIQIEDKVGNKINKFLPLHIFNDFAVCKKWLVHEDGVLAHKLQNEESKSVGNLF